METLTIENAQDGMKIRNKISNITKELRWGGGRWFVVREANDAPIRSEDFEQWEIVEDALVPAQEPPEVPEVVIVFEISADDYAISRSHFDHLIDNHEFSAIVHFDDARFADKATINSLIREAIVGEHPAVGDTLAENKRLRELNAELEAKLLKWPRVYWASSDPKSLLEGYPVLSVAGKTSGDDVWLDVYVDNPDWHEEYFAAPDDFGLYASSEEAAALTAAKELEK